MKSRRTVRTIRRAIGRHSRVEFEQLRASEFQDVLLGGPRCHGVVATWRAAVLDVGAEQVNYGVAFRERREAIDTLREGGRVAHVRAARIEHVSSGEEHAGASIVQRDAGGLMPRIGITSRHAVPEVDAPRSCGHRLTPKNARTEPVSRPQDRVARPAATGCRRRRDAVCVAVGTIRSVDARPDRTSMLYERVDRGADATPPARYPATKPARARKADREMASRSWCHAPDADEKASLYLCTRKGTLPAQERPRVPIAGSYTALQHGR